MGQSLRGQVEIYDHVETILDSTTKFWIFRIQRRIAILSIEIGTYRSWKV